MNLRFITPVEITDNTGRQYNPSHLTIRAENIVAIYAKPVKSASNQPPTIKVITNATITACDFVDGKDGYYATALEFNLDYETPERFNLAMDRLNALTPVKYGSNIVNI